jgi:hypothetical protein
MAPMISLLWCPRSCLVITRRSFGPSGKVRIFVYEIFVCWWVFTC